LIACLSLVIMQALARAKRKVAHDLESHAMKADSRQTDFCSYLSGILLGGLLLNAWLGWWWADPVAGLAMAPIIAKEGIDSLRGKSCCDECCRHLEIT
jgi:divalent metal cation (Fe/Co/Zn/Cd) transporter